MQRWNQHLAVASMFVLTSWFPSTGLLGVARAEEPAAPVATEPAETTAPADAAPAEQAAPADPALASIDAFIADKKIDTGAARWKTSLPKPPKVDFAEGATYFWVLDTNVGPIRVRLDPKIAPMHVSSTIYLTRLGFYDGLAFHRVIPGFMAQGGDPLGSGTGGPGYSYDGEISPAAKHVGPGVLSMANTGRPSSDGSQFFLTFTDTPWLDGRHTVFGKVVEGLDTVRELEKAGTPSGRPTRHLEIEKATIEVQPAG